MTARVKMRAPGRDAREVVVKGDAPPEVLVELAERLWAQTDVPIAEQLAVAFGFTGADAPGGETAGDLDPDEDVPDVEQPASGDEDPAPGPLPAPDATRQTRGANTP